MGLSREGDNWQVAREESVNCHLYQKLELVMRQPPPEWDGSATSPSKPNRTWEGASGTHPQPEPSCLSGAHLISQGLSSEQLEAQWVGTLSLLMS